MPRDRVTIGLTSDGRALLDAIMASGVFEDQIALARLALAAAVEAEIEPDILENTTTIWNVGSFDPEGELRAVLRALYPALDAPSRAMEYLIEEGLRLLNDRIEHTQSPSAAMLLDAIERAS